MTIRIERDCTKRMMKSDDTKRMENNVIHGWTPMYSDCAIKIESDGSVSRAIKQPLNYNLLKLLL